MRRIGEVGQTAEMVQNRHPQIAAEILRGLSNRAPGYMRAVQESGDRLRLVGVDVPPWEAIAQGLQHVVWPTLSPPEQAMVRS